MLANVIGNWDTLGLISWGWGCPMVRNSRCLELSPRLLCSQAGSRARRGAASSAPHLPSWEVPLGAGCVGMECCLCWRLSAQLAHQLSLGPFPLPRFLGAHEVLSSMFRKVWMTRGSSDLMMYR